MSDSPMLTPEALKAGGHAVWKHTAGYPSTAQTENAGIAVRAFLAAQDREALARVVDSFCYPEARTTASAHAHAVIDALLGEREHREGRLG